MDFESDNDPLAAAFTGAFGAATTVRTSFFATNETRKAPLQST
jgi:hypothetical protein